MMWWCVCVGGGGSFRLALVLYVCISLAGYCYGLDHTKACRSSMT